MKKNLFLWLWILFSSFVFSTVFASTNPLTDTSWNLSSYNGSGAYGTLSFDSSMMYSKFCNNVSQWYSYSDGKIVSQWNGISTLMYCQWLPMTLEDNFSISTWTTVVMSWTQMTITTSAKNTYVFVKHEDIPAICTKEYMPVCGQVQVQCIKAPCHPVQETFGNACMAKAVWATDITQGECTTNTGTVIGWDKDEYGCLVSAGYSWNIAKQQCTRSREDIATWHIVWWDKDIHGCKSSAWYTRNVSKKECTRSREDEVKATCKLGDKDLQMYSKDKSSVKILQSQLKKLGYFKIKPTGNFGFITKKALQQFQKDNDIQTTGKLWPVTRHALQQVCSVK